MNHPILIPVAILALWSLCVTCLMFLSRLSAIRSGAVRYSYFRVLQAHDKPVPEKMVQISRHYSNLYEMPTLFYALCAILIATNLSADTWFVVGSWIYLVTRLMHSLVHLTYNNITHRLIPFALSVLVLAGMWIKLLLVELSI